MNNITTIIAIITSITGLIGAIGGIFTALWKLFKKIDSIQEEFKENTLATLRLVIINEHIPLEERINAGRKYINMGGNGAIRKIVMKLEDEEADKIMK